MKFYYLDRKIASDLYLNLLTPWEKVFSVLPIKGSFDIRSKEFSAFKREYDFKVVVLSNQTESDKAIIENKLFNYQPKQLAIFSKGDNSRARSLFKHLRNAIAHAQIVKVKIQNKWYLIFSAQRDGKYVLKVQIQQSNLGELIAALKSTAKNI